MNTKTTLLLGTTFIVIVVAFLGIAGALPGMKAGADTIADTITSGTETYVMWKGAQTLYPNKHAIERHGQDAWDSVDCYNRNGAFYIMSNPDGRFNLLCKDNNGQVRDVILQRRDNSNVFDFVNAYTPKDGNFAHIKYWLENTWKSAQDYMPNDAVIVIDHFIP